MTKNKTDADPLLALLGGGAEVVDREKLAAFLKPFVVLGMADGSFGFLPPFRALTLREKTEVILCAAKARSLLFDGKPDGVTSGEFVALQVMPSGSATPSIKKLYDTHAIKKDKDGRYFLPAYMIDAVVERFNKKSKKDL